jgi:hypothetical protein
MRKRLLTLKAYQLLHKGQLIKIRVDIVISNIYNINNTFIILQRNT